MFRPIWEFFGQISPTTHIFTPTTWTVQHRAGVNTQATITKAAGVKSGQRHVATSLTIALVADSTAPAAVVVQVALIDGDSGGTTYLWGPHDISLPAVAGAMNGFVVPIWAVGSANTTMTLEFSAAAGANTFESVTLEGLTIA